MTFDRRTPAPSRQQRLAQRQRRMAKVAASVKPRAAVMDGTTTGPAPKEMPLRDDALLQMAKGKPCMLLVPGVCNHRTDTTVACHENQNKGMAIKASDEKSVWGCFACHTWYDTGTAPRAQKRQAFMEAHLRQVLAWRQVAGDPNEPERFRRAARRALEHLNATPVPEARVCDSVHTEVSSKP